MAISDNQAVCVDDVLADLRRAGEYCESMDEHEAAAFIGRAYRHLDRKEDTLRTRENHVSDVRSP